MLARGRVSGTRMRSDHDHDLARARARELLSSLNFVLVLVLVLVAWATTAVQGRNPLDPVCPVEAERCVAFLTSHSPPSGPEGPYFNPDTDRLSSFYDQDPPKAEVLKWMQSRDDRSFRATRLPSNSAQASESLSHTRTRSIPRKFFFIITKPTGVWLGVVDPSAGTVEGWRQINVVNEGGPPVDMLEFFTIPSVVLSNPDFISALSRRGLSPSEVQCIPMS